jgi:hypothetical protein
MIFIPGNRPSVGKNISYPSIKKYYTSFINQTGFQIYLMLNFAKMLLKA